MRVVFCGVRGSIPTPGDQFQRVGGNTSCLAIAHDGALPTLVLDAGTGLRTLARMFGDRPFRGSIVLGHLHWDHMIGLPFFPPGDRPDAEVRLYLPEQGAGALELLERTMSPPTFPITPAQLRGAWSFETYDERSYEWEGFRVTAREIPHKGGRTMGLRVSDGRSSLAYLSDHAPHDLGPGSDGLGALHPAALELADGVDMLVHDAQYTAEELPSRAGWGHAAAEYAVTLGVASSARRVALYHHDPSRTDLAVAQLCERLQHEDGPLVLAAREGDEFTL